MYNTAYIALLAAEEIHEKASTAASFVLSVKRKSNIPVSSVSNTMLSLRPISLKRPGGPRDPESTNKHAMAGPTMPTTEMMV